MDNIFMKLKPPVRQYEEKRDFVRVNLPHPSISIDKFNSKGELIKSFSGEAINLSASGVLFRVLHKFKSGDHIRVRIESVGVEPFSAMGEVVRVNKGTEIGEFRVAAEFSEILQLKPAVK